MQGIYDSIVLDENQVQFLLGHVGYGSNLKHPDRVKFLFIGNESGTAGRSTKDYVERLTKPHKYLYENYGEENTDCFSLQKRTSMLQFINRLRLYNTDNNPKWLEPKSYMSTDEYRRVVRECWTESDTVHLMDIRPLPRKTENESKVKWPYREINEIDYMQAFTQFNLNNNQYTKWVDVRKRHLVNKISQFINLKCIIAAGAVEMKLRFIENLYPDIKFDKVKGQSNRIFYISRENNNQAFKVIVCPFLSSYVLGFSGLKDLAKFSTL